MNKTKCHFKFIRHSIEASIALLLVCYWFDNIPYPFGSRTNFLTLKESIARKVNKSRPDYDSVVFINTGYDVQLVKTNNGVEAITNRDSLLQFLRDIQDFEYRYIFIDIRFEDGLTTPADSALVSQICSMRDITVAKHWNYKKKTDYELIDKSLMKKAAYCDYTYSLYNTSFSRYQYIQENGNSAALEIYKNVNNSNIKTHFNLWYSDHGGLCFNSLFLPITDNFANQESSFDHSAKYLNLGSDIYGWYGLEEWFTISDLKEYCKNKIICIGDFAFDLHDTYNGKQPGTYIHWLAYDCLCKGKHKISWLMIVFLIVIYASLFYCKTIQFDLSHLFKKSRLLSFIISLLGTGTILSAICYISYLYNGTIISIFVPTIILSLYSYYIQYKTYECKP